MIFLVHPGSAVESRFCEEIDKYHIMYQKLCTFCMHVILDIRSFLKIDSVVNSVNIQYGIPYYSTHMYDEVTNTHTSSCGEMSPGPASSLVQSLPSSAVQLSTHSLKGLPSLRHCTVAVAMLRAWLSCSYLFCLAAQGLSSPVKSGEGLVADQAPSNG